MPPLSHHSQNEATPLPERGSSADISRRSFMGGMTAIAVASSGVIKAASIIDERLNPEIKPSGPVEATSQPIPSDFYTADSKGLDVPTLHTLDSLESYLSSCAELEDSRHAETLAYQWLSGCVGSIAIGHTERLEDWLEYASIVATRTYGILVKPAELKADYGSPTLSVTIEVLQNIGRKLGAYPKTIMEHRPKGRTKPLGELALVDLLKISGWGKVQALNGAVDLKNRNLVTATNNKETGEPRAGAAGDVRDRRCGVIDRDISRTEDTFNDPEFALLNTNPLTEEMLNDPANYKRAVDEIALAKIRCLANIFSGQILPPSEIKDTSERDLYIKQHELMLQRLLGTYPQVPAEYYRALQVFNTKHGRAPQHQEELTGTI